ncbi:MFS transporter [Aeromicrobium piscarium]|uniref:MFS transporter n=1 Tax=Aeromicrobium piscarium TaxID=2590901 RepID=A0A554RI42_9ACTN|nr:MFS transporter [Aeromicrobium piscarium]TSD53789.1 MFS transporter [Aeromicrobium piscarium]
MTDRGEEFSWRSVIVGGYGPNTLYGIAEGAFLPVAALSARALGASVGLAAATVVVFGAGSLLANIPAGRLVRRFGERGALVVGGAIGVLGALVCLYAGWVGVYMVGVFLLGGAGAVFKLARQSYLTRVVPYRRRALAMSSLGGVYRIGLFIGPVIGGLVISAHGLSSTFWVVLVAMALGGMLGLFVSAGDDETAPARPPRVAELVVEHRRVFATVGVGIMLVGAVRAARAAALPLWADHVGLQPEQVSFIFALSSLADVLLFLPAGLATDRFGRRAVSVPAMLLTGVSLIALPATHSVATMSVIAVLLGIGNGFTAGIIQILGADYAPAHQRAEFLSLWRVLADIGMLSGPGLISAVAAAAALGPAILAVGTAGLAGAVALQLSLRRPPGT